MKKYRLLKDLPLAEASEELYIEHYKETRRFILYKDINKMSVGSLHEDYIENFDEWFEEIGELEWVYYINAFGGVVDSVRVANLPGVRTNLKSTGNYFETEQEAEKYLAYLKAKEVIKQDTNGFKVDWKNDKQDKFHGQWDYSCNKLYAQVDWELRDDTIYFKSHKDIKESFNKHPKEWKTYLTYEQ